MGTKKILLSGKITSTPTQIKTVTSNATKIDRLYVSKTAVDAVLASYEKLNLQVDMDNYSTAPERYRYPIDISTAIQTYLFSFGKTAKDNASTYEIVKFALAKTLKDTPRIPNRGPFQQDYFAADYVIDPLSYSATGEIKFSISKPFSDNSTAVETFGFHYYTSFKDTVSTTDSLNTVYNVDVPDYWSYDNSGASDYIYSTFHKRIGSDSLAVHDFIVDGSQLDTASGLFSVTDYSQEIARANETLSYDLSYHLADTASFSQILSYDLAYHINDTSTFAQKLSYDLSYHTQDDSATASSKFALSLSKATIYETTANTELFKISTGLLKKDTATTNEDGYIHMDSYFSGDYINFSRNTYVGNSYTY